MDGDLPWKNCSIEEFHDHWEYKSIEAEGRYAENDIYISNTKDQETGYKIISPFYTKNDTNRRFPILVERGWVPKGDENLIKKDRNKIVRIKGLLYSGDKKNKYTLLDSIDYTKDKDKNIYTFPDLIAGCLELPNKEDSGKGLLKIVNFQNDHKNALPVLPTPNEFLNWYITPERHGAYSAFWFTVTVMNLMTNVYVWVFL